MKKFLFSSVVMMSLSMTAGAWNTGSESFPVTDYGTTRQENLHAAGLPGGSTFVVWTMQDDSRSHCDLYLQVIDAEGNMKLPASGKRINTVDGPSYVSAGISVVATSTESCLVIAGDPRDTEESFYNLPYVYALDAEGNVKGTPEGEPVAPGIASANKYSLYAFGDNYYATFDANEPGTYNAFTYVMKVSAEGKSMWDAPLKLIAGNCSLTASGDDFIAVGTSSNRLIAGKYTAEGESLWDDGKEIHPKTSMWGGVPSYSDGEGGAYVPYEYTDTEYNTHKPLAHIAADGTVNSTLLESLSPQADMNINESSLYPFPDGKFLVLTCLRKGYSGNYFLNGAVYDGEGNITCDAAGVTLDEASIGFNFISNLNGVDNSAVIIYVHPDSYTETSFMALNVNTLCEDMWKETLVSGSGVSQFCTVSGGNCFTTYFVEAPGDDTVGVRGLRASIKGGFTVSSYDLDVTVSEPGTLASLLPEDMSGIKSMSISGSINGTDVKTIREIALHVAPFEGEKGYVKVFDFKNATIVAGGEAYHNYYDWNVYDNVDVYTEDNVFPAFIFQDYSIEKVVFPDNIKGVGRDALYNCAKIAEINLPEGVEAIGYEAFAGTAITSIKLPSTITSIGAYAFYSTNLTTFTLPAGITELPEGMLQATYLETIDLANQVTKIGYNVFKDCAYLESVTGFDNVVTIGNYEFYNCLKLSETPVSAKTESIGTEAFINCSSIQKVEVPAALTYIGQRAFVNCASLKEINVAEDNTEYASVAGMLFTKNMETLITCPSGYTDDVELPEGIASISKSGFEACAQLKNVTLPSSMKEIGNEAFKLCVSLEHLTSKAEVPPVLGWDNPFWGVPVESCVLTVPTPTAQKAYQEADGWKEFVNIVSLTPTGIANISADDDSFEWYTLKGVRLDSRPVMPGLYLRKRAGQKAEKIIL